MDKKFISPDKPFLGTAGGQGHSSSWLAARDLPYLAEIDTWTGVNAFPDSFSNQAATLRGVMGLQGRVRFWRCNSTLGWQACAAKVHLDAKDEGAVVLRLPQDGYSTGDYLLVEVAGDDYQSREFSMVPWHWTTQQHTLGEVVIVVDTAPAHLAMRKNRHRLRVRATVMDSDLALLSGYLLQGDMKALETVNEHMAPRAETLLADKLENPLLATAAALALLKTQQIKMLHNWTRNLAAWFPRLPDGPIIRAWHLLYDKNGGGVPIGNKNEPLQLLLDAAQRGLPVFAESLRLLVSGLRLFKHENNRRAKRRLTTIEPYLWAADPDEVFTSFKGALPNAPGSVLVPARDRRQDWAFHWSNEDPIGGSFTPAGVVLR